MPKRTRETIESDIAVHLTAIATLRRELLVLQKAAKVCCPHCDKESAFEELILVVPHEYREPVRPSTDGQWIEAANKRYALCPHCFKTFYEANMKETQRVDFATTPGIFKHRLKRYGERYYLVQMDGTALEGMVELPVLNYLGEAMGRLRREALLMA